MIRLVEEINKQLSSKIDKSIVTELLKEYVETKKSWFLNDPEKTILHAGKFSEMTMVAIKNIFDGSVINFNNIDFDSLYNEIKNSPRSSPTTAEEELLYLAIPRVARSLYTIRSKKRVAHIKTLDPNFLDSYYVLNACDWILSSFLLLYHTTDVKKVAMIINSLVERKIPLIQEFEDGGIIVLKPYLDFKWELLIVLYHQNKRVTNSELKNILKPKYLQLLTTNLADLEKEKLIHRNREGAIITKLGIQKIETEFIIPIE